MAQNSLQATHNDLWKEIRRHTSRVGIPAISLVVLSRVIIFSTLILSGRPALVE